MGKLWRVDKALEDSEGLRWVRERLGTYDWAKVDWITVRRGRTLYRNPDGTWPQVPQGHKAGDRYASSRDGKRAQWRRLYRPLELRSQDEVLVFLVAHEAFQYLRRTKQVEGRHGEIEADVFALKILEQYREGSTR